MKFLTALAFIILLAIIARLLFFSFGAQSPSDYAGKGPAFDPLQHLSGPILAEGILYGPRGRVTNTFVAEMNGEWDGDAGTLAEEFTYASGMTQSRKWYLTRAEDGTYSATADDIVGPATMEVSGNTLMLRYTIVLPEEGGGQTLNVTDWLYLTENGTIINRSQMRKFGVLVAELVATMRPTPE